MRPQLRLVLCALIACASLVLTSCTSAGGLGGTTAVTGSPTTKPGAANPCGLSADVLKTVKASQCSKIPATPTSCAQNPAPYNDTGEHVVGDTHVRHDTFLCGHGFTGYLDFRFFGVGLTSPDIIVREKPSRQSGGINNFRIVQGGSGIEVKCQARGDTYHEGSINGHITWYSAVWDKVYDPALTSKDHTGWVPDIWFGNMGWRGIPC